MIKLHLTQGYVAFIDDADCGRVMRYRWRVHFNNQRIPYARATLCRGGDILLGRFLLSTPVDMECDHINGNTLDYRRINLENVTKLENLRRRDVRQEKIKQGTFIYEAIGSDAASEIPF